MKRGKEPVAGVSNLSPGAGCSKLSERSPHGGCGAGAAGGPRHQQRTRGQCGGPLCCTLPTAKQNSPLGAPGVGAPRGLGVAPPRYQPRLFPVTPPRGLQVPRTQGRSYGMRARPGSTPRSQPASFGAPPGTPNGKEPCVHRQQEPLSSAAGFALLPAPCPCSFTARGRAGK